MEVVPEHEQKQPGESPKREARPLGVLLKQWRAERKTRKLRNTSSHRDLKECLIFIRPDLGVNFTYLSSVEHCSQLFTSEQITGS